MKLPQLPKTPTLALGLLIVVLIAVAAGVVFQTKVLSWQLSGSSRAKIYLSRHKVVAEFQIAPYDRENLGKFTHTLGAGDAFAQGFSAEVDEQTAESLKTFLPIEVKMNIFPGKIDFSSNGQSSLSRLSEGSEIFQSAAGEGALKVEDLGGRNFQIEIENPKQVLSQATVSGKLRLSQSLSTSGFWQLAAKLAKIKLKVNDRFLEGTVVLW